MRSFTHTMDILVKAYLNDTLRHGNCLACAVGNICNGRTDWANVFVTDGSEQQRFGPFISRNNVPFGAEGDYYSGIQLIESTGYSIDELAKIEFAFETAEGRYDDNNDTWMFNGLMAVLDVLADIHQVDLSGKKIYQDALTEIYQS